MIFFATFNVCSEHYDEARYFSAGHPWRFAPAKWFKAGAVRSRCPLTIAMLCEAASHGRWPEKDY
ncbi:DUF1493 family protein [Pantoea sp. AS142]|uniref:DUF1493 family protein n=1 Tax=Pantoea sp. AS142 TaxID=3081292 RepID=UPI003016FA94